MNSIYYSRDEGGTCCCPDLGPPSTEPCPAAAPSLGPRWASPVCPCPALSSSVPAVNAFWVTVQRTEAAERCELRGTYVLKAERDSLILKDPRTDRILYVWPYRLLRRYGRDKVGNGEPRVLQVLPRSCSLVEGGADVLQPALPNARTAAAPCAHGRVARDICHPDCPRFPPVSPCWSVGWQDTHPLCGCPTFAEAIAASAAPFLHPSTSQLVP